MNVTRLVRVAVVLGSDLRHVQRPNLSNQVLQRRLRQRTCLKEHLDRVTVDRHGGQRANADGIREWVAASVSTLPNTMSGCFSEAASYTGANTLHAPHQVAQKSRMTRPVLSGDRLKILLCYLDRRHFRPLTVPSDWTHQSFLQSSLIIPARACHRRSRTSGSRSTADAEDR